MRRFLKRSFLVCAAACVVYLAVLAYPQPLFAHEVTRDRLTVHSTKPMPGAMQATVTRAHGRLLRSPLYRSLGHAHVFLCDPQPLFAVFARQNYRVGGVADWAVGQHAFLRESDMHNDRLIAPSGTPVAADRPLSYFIAHEAMHIAIARHLGRARYSQLPQWLDDGYADYIARDIDYAKALQQFKEDAPELDPRRSGLYLRYQLMVAYLIEQKGVAIEQLLDSPPDRDAVERELRALMDWPSS
jgi:hypothetical protein